jgi:hypothetical protein
VRSEARIKKLGSENKFTKVFIAKDKSEELDVKKQNAEDADTQHPQDHHQEQVCQGVIARDKSEKLDVKKQNAEDDDTQHPQDHHQEQARRGVRRERQV